MLHIPQPGQQTYLQCIMIKTPAYHQFVIKLFAHTSTIHAKDKLL